MAGGKRGGWKGAFGAMCAVAGASAAAAWLANVWLVWRALARHGEECRRQAALRPGLERHAAENLVTREQLEERLEWLQRRVASAAAAAGGDKEAAEQNGIGGELRRLVGREAAVFLLGGRAALLQLAHPYVATAIQQHSALATSVVARFYGTFRFVFRITFGDLQAALSSARTVHQMHSRVGGAFSEEAGAAAPAGGRYDANNRQALVWVWATLHESSVLAYELFVRPLSLAEKRGAYEERAEFLACFGLAPRDTPPSWEAFQAYCHHMWNSDILRVGSDALQVERLLFTPPTPALARAYWLVQLIRRSTSVLLPAAVARQFGSAPSRAHHALFYALAGLIRLILVFLPGSLRYLSAYHRLQQRLGHRMGPLNLYLSDKAADAARALLNIAIPVPPQQQSTSASVSSSSSTSSSSSSSSSLLSSST
ncbi:MAG: oxygenase MpaB family protein [archaeon]|nr:oxygenase MpaB family protein [archaeon]